jgi:hypothetical protein
MTGIVAGTLVDLRVEQSAVMRLHVGRQMIHRGNDAVLHLLDREYIVKIGHRGEGDGIVGPELSVVGLGGVLRLGLKGAAHPRHMVGRVNHIAQKSRNQVAGRNWPANRGVDCSRLDVDTNPGDRPWPLAYQSRPCPRVRAGELDAGKQ